MSVLTAPLFLIPSDFLSLSVMISPSDVYRDAWVWLADNLRVTLERLSQLFGSEVLAVLAIGLVLVPIAAAFVWLQYVLLPKFVRWWYEESVTQKAHNWWTKHRLFFLGFKRSTAVIAVICGSLFFVLIRVAAAFPTHVKYTIPVLVGVFVFIAVLGFFVSGNVPQDENTRHQYFKRFQSPTVTGAGLAIASVVTDFVIGLATVAIQSLLQFI